MYYCIIVWCMLYIMYDNNIGYRKCIKKYKCIAWRQKYFSLVTTNNVYWVMLYSVSSVSLGNTVAITAGHWIQVKQFDSFKLLRSTYILQWAQILFLFIGVSFNRPTQSLTLSIIIKKSVFWNIAFFQTSVCHHVAWLKMGKHSDCI